MSLTLSYMEWLLIVYLGILEVPSPPPVEYATRAECVEAAKKLASENEWLHYFETSGSKVDPSVLRPTVHCEPAEWSKSPPGSK